MNRFDRVTSLLLLLQTRSIVTAKFLSEHFDVSERTIYRDIRTLENAGVPIGAEAGVGYFLEKSYHLPPVSFSINEAASLMLGEKLLVASLDDESLKDFKSALNKVRSVIDHQDKDYLSTFDSDTHALPTGSQFPLENVGILKRNSERAHQSSENTQRNFASQSSDRWLRESRKALLNRHLIEIQYASLSQCSASTRVIEPIGLFYYNWHWHLIAWCQLRRDYRDFRLDRISSFIIKDECFKRDSRLTLNDYLNDQPGRDDFYEVDILFTREASRYVEEQRYMFGFYKEESREDGVLMRFLTPVPDYMARWLLQYTNGIQVLKGDVIRTSLKLFSKELYAHWLK